MGRPEQRTIIITGATSGIGTGLTLEFVRRGFAVGITGRNASKLEQTLSEVQAAYPEATQPIARLLEATDYEKNFPVIAELTKALGGRLDILVANAGVGGGKRPGQQDFERNQNCIEVNVIGAIATLSAGFEVMKSRKAGQLVGISSVASFRGFPGGAAYSASKAALSTYLEGLRGEVRGKGIRVTAIHPGFIDTPINNHLEKRPFLVSQAKGSRLIANRIEAGVRSATVPWFPWALAVRAMRWMPDFIWTRATAL